MKKFWKWTNLADADPAAERILELNGTIAEESWFDDEVTPAVFKAELFNGSGPVTIWLNSPGGDCIAASQIYAMLMDYKGEVTVKIDGIAALRCIRHCYGRNEGTYGTYSIDDDPQSCNGGIR